MIESQPNVRISQSVWSQNGLNHDSSEIASFSFNNFYPTIAIFDSNNGQRINDIYLTKIGQNGTRLKTLLFRPLHCVSRIEWDGNYIASGFPHNLVLANVLTNSVIWSITENWSETHNLWFGEDESELFLNMSLVIMLITVGLFLSLDFTICYLLTVIGFIYTLFLFGLSISSVTILGDGLLLLSSGLLLKSEKQPIKKPLNYLIITTSLAIIVSLINILTKSGFL